MIQEIYSIDELAIKLGIPARKVQQLAGKNELETFKKEGKLFATADSVVAYLEKIMHQQKNDGQVDDFMESTGSTVDPDTFSLLNFLSIENIIVPLDARTSGSVIRTLVTHGFERGQIWDPDRMIEVLKNREELDSTALSNGVALPHPARPLANIISETFIMLGVASNGVPFGGGRDNLTDIFFLICSCEREIHLNIMRAIAQLISQEDFLSALRSASTPLEARELIKKYEVRIDGNNN